MAKKPLEHLEYENWTQMQKNLEEVTQIRLTLVEIGLHTLLVALEVLMFQSPLIIAKKKGTTSEARPTMCVSFANEKKHM